MNKTIFKAIPVIALAMTLAGCSKGYEYTPAEKEESGKTIISADLSTPRSIDADGADIVIPFLRNNTSGSLEANISLDDPSGIFKLANSTIKFADGQKSADAVVTYSYDALVPETIYNIAVSVATPEYASDYAASSFPVACKKAWANLGIAQFYDDWFVGGPFEKTLLKSPDGSETYRLLDPWNEAEVTAGGLDFVAPMPYFEFKIDEAGNITYGNQIDLGFTFSGRTCHFMYPAVEGDDASAAQNKMVMDLVAQFVWYPEMNNGKNWWGRTSVAYISFPGGPDLVELLELGGE